MSTRISIAIVGGGAVGCAVAWALSKEYSNVFVFEKNPAISRGDNQSSRNSGVIHSGIYYDQETRPEKAALCVEGNRLLYGFCNRFRVPALKVGKLIVATEEIEEEELDQYLERARENGVPRVERISGDRVKEIEPNVRARSALCVHTAGILDPTALVYRLHTLASRQGVHFITGTEVVGAESNGELIRLCLSYPDGRKEDVEARTVVNAGGIYGDCIARMADPDSPYELDPVSGVSYKFYRHKRPELMLNGTNVYPIPRYVATQHGRHFTVGVHLTPTFGETGYPPVLGTTVTVGPRLVPMGERNPKTEAKSSPESFVNSIRPFFPGLRVNDLLWHQSGLQARLKGYLDFVISSLPTSPNFINLLGIDSPGLTSCLAIGRRVKEKVDELWDSCPIR